MIAKHWRIASPLSPEAAAQFATHRDIHPVIAQVLYNRGLVDPQSALAFLHGTIQLGEPFRMEGMAKAVGRLRLAIKRKEPIVVYGDFDADGVTSTALLVTALHALGAKVQPYIPHRVDEGYGLNETALLKLAERGARVVVTVDCGIRSLYEVEVGKHAGLDLIVTDHHSVGPEVPKALAVINPKQANCKYPEKMLAGVGVTYKLVQALFKAAHQQDHLEPPLADDLLVDLVAIGTVADLAPLDSAENRQLVLAGLQAMRISKRPGLRALLEVSGIPISDLNADSIGFAIGPRLNAAGRLDSAMSAYQLLSTNDPIEAAALAQSLQELNAKRQQLTRDMQEYARTLTGAGQQDVPLIFAADPNFLQGIVGLVAGRLTEEYYRPSIVVHVGEHESHGSCRSITEFNITAALDQCADLLLRHGGHAQAAGFAIANENLPLFRERMLSLAQDGLHDQTLQPSLDLDMEVPLRWLNENLVQALATLEPCGHSFEAPLLCTRKLRVVEARGVGRENQHLKVRLTDGQQVADGILFNYGDTTSALPTVVDVAYSPELNVYNGSRSVQLYLSDIRPHNAE